MPARRRAISPSIVPASALHRSANHKTIHEMKSKLLATIIGLAFAQAAHCEPLFTQSGSDPSFEQLRKSRKLPEGHNSKSGVTGSKIQVNTALVETTPESRRPIPRDILIHTLGNSAIPRSDFGKWSRWYQESGHTQVFRLFKDEENVRNSRAMAARIEAFSKLGWGHGAWHEWSGTYTIVKPHAAAIFQAKNTANDWSVQLNMNDNGDILLNHRRGKDVTILNNMTGKPFHIRVRDNGLDYEVFLNGKLAGKGSYARPSGHTNFRWGLYRGGKEMKHDAMIFVSGATIDGR